MIYVFFANGFEDVYKRQVLRTAAAWATSAMWRLILAQGSCVQLLYLAARAGAALAGGIMISVSHGRIFR